MSRRWTMSDDLFLAQYAGAVDANLVAKMDLHFTGKNAGENRVAKLKATGVWDLLQAHVKTYDDLAKAWVNAFGSNSAREFMDAMSDTPSIHGELQ